MITISLVTLDGAVALSKQNSVIKRTTSVGVATNTSPWIIAVNTVTNQIYVAPCHAFEGVAFSPPAWGWVRGLCRTSTAKPSVFPTCVGMVRGSGCCRLLLFRCPQEADVSESFGALENGNFVEDH